MVRLTGAWPPALADQVTASLANGTKEYGLGSPGDTLREERAKSSVLIVVLISAVKPGPEPSGRLIDKAPALGVIGLVPVTSQL